MSGHLASLVILLLPDHLAAITLLLLPNQITSLGMLLYMSWSHGITRDDTTSFGMLPHLGHLVSLV